MALVSLPILGADFLYHHSLLLDVSNQRVFRPASPASPEVSLTSAVLSSSSLHATLLSTPQCISDLLSEFPNVLSSDVFMASKPRHQIRHPLLTQPGPPVFAKPQSLDPEKLASAKADFYAMEKAGII